MALKTFLVSAFTFFVVTNMALAQYTGLPNYGDPAPQYQIDYSAQQQQMNAQLYSGSSNEGALVYPAHQGGNVYAAARPVHQELASPGGWSIAWIAIGIAILFIIIAILLIACCLCCAQTKCWGSRKKKRCNKKDKRDRYYRYD